MGGRLTSVDEGVVLESSSDSANSREKLTPGHFENVHMEYVHDKNEELRQKLQEYEKENSSLNLRIRHLEALVAQGTTPGFEAMSEEWKGELRDELKTKIEVADHDEEREKLYAKLQECRAKLLENDSRISSLSDSEQALRSEVLEKERALEKTKEQNAQLNLRLKDLESLENGRSEKPLWEEKLRTSEQEKAELNCKVVELERKLQLSGVRQASVKEYERRLRAELCKEMTRKLVEAQTRSRELGDTILELESKIREAKQQSLSGQTDSVISGLRSRLESIEGQNRELSNQAQEQEVQLQEAQQIEMANKEEVLSLREKVCCLEKSELILREKAGSLESENRRLLDDSTAGRSLPSRSAERKVKALKLEKDSLRSEVQTFRENTLALESQLLRQDQEILDLKNQVVDLKSEVAKGGPESRDTIKRRSEIEDSFSGERKIQSELNLHGQDNKELKDKTAAFSVDNACLLSSFTKGPLQLCNSEPSSVTEGEVSSSLLQHQYQGNGKETTIHHLQENISELSQDKEKLEGCIVRLEQENTRLIEENRFFADRSKTMGDRVRRFSEEKDTISQECILKNVENEALRTYASLCSDEAKSLKAYMSANKTYVCELEEKVHKLELEMIVAKGDVLSGTCNTELLEEQKSTLEKKMREANRAVDRVKEELLNLTTSVLTSQKELASVLDRIMIELGAGDLCKKVSLGRQVSSTDSNHGCPSFCSDDIGSEASDVFFSESLLSCVLFPDEECFLNSSEISIVRENKAEILSLHEHLKAKLVTVKEFLNYGKPLNPGDAGRIARESRTDPGLQSSSCDSVLSEERRARKRIGNYTLPTLEGAEKARLSSLLTSSSKTQSAETQRASQQSMYEAYLELEDQFLQLSNHLVTKEDELFDVLTKKKKLEQTLSDCQQGIVLCEHCAAKDPSNLEESRRLLKARLLSHIEETSRLETEMVEVLEYRDQLDEELSEVKQQVAAMELRVRPKRLNSDTDSLSSEEQKPCLPEKRGKAQKRVTFENVQDNVDGNSNIPQPRKQEDAGNDTKKAKAKVWQESDMNGCDVDLCELLASVSVEVCEVKPAERSEDDPEVAQNANRLSAYDNMSYKEKLAFVLSQRQQRGDTVDGNLIEFLDNPSTHRIFKSGKAKCRMCGLFSKRTTADHEDDGSYTKTRDT